MRNQYSKPSIQKRRVIRNALAKETNPEKIFKLGLMCLDDQMLKEAHKIFQHIFKYRPKVSHYRSYLGLTTAMVEKQYKTAVKLCESAVEADFFHPELFCNLGRVYLMAGKRSKAFHTFKKGLIVDGENRYLKQELAKMGIRKPPVFPFLKRNNPLNWLAGKMRYRISSNLQKTPPENSVVSAGQKSCFSGETCHDFLGRPQPTYINRG